MQINETQRHKISGKNNSFLETPLDKHKNSHPFTIQIDYVIFLTKNLYIHLLLPFTMSIKQAIMDFYPDCLSALVKNSHTGFLSVLYSD